MNPVLAVAGVKDRETGKIAARHVQHADAPHVAEKTKGGARVYKRVEGKHALSDAIHSFDTLRDIPLPFDDVQVFMQEKWRVAGDKAGREELLHIDATLEEVLRAAFRQVKVVEDPSA